MKYNSIIKKINKLYKKKQGYEEIVFDEDHNNPIYRYYIEQAKYVGNFCLMQDNSGEFIKDSEGNIIQFNSNTFNYPKPKSLEIDEKEVHTIYGKFIDHLKRKFDVEPYKSVLENWSIEEIEEIENYGKNSFKENLHCCDQSESWYW